MKVVFFCHIMSFYRSLTFLFHPKNLQLSLMQFLQESLHCLKAHIPYHLFVIHSKQQWVKLVSYHTQVTNWFVLFFRRKFKPYVIAYWSNFTNISNWKKVWLLPHKYLIVNKVREVSFKLIHRFYPVNSLPKKNSNLILTQCATFLMFKMKRLYIYFGTVIILKCFGTVFASL